MDIEIKEFRVAPGKEVKLEKWPTRVDPYYKSKQEYRALLDLQVTELSGLQQKLYASNSYALLVIFQGMDASGKDSAIKHVMSGINPQGCQVFSFKHPTAIELDHDFLWRTTRALPERGRIGIFNRSYYEDVLVVRVHPEILSAQRIPDSVIKNGNIWQERFHSIAGLEHHLHINGTRVVKFFLHLSKEEQRKRFLARIDEEDKNWKITQDDIKERGFWDQYMQAYEECIGKTSTDEAPWYIVPADDKANSRLIISKVILATLESLELAYPVPTDEHRAELKSIRKELSD